MSSRSFRRHKVSRALKTLAKKLAEFFVVETIESVLEWSHPFGLDVREGLQEKKLSTGKYILAMLADLGEHHALTMVGMYAMSLFGAVSFTEFLVFLRVIAYHFPHIGEGNPLVTVVAVLGPFVCGYLTSVLTHIAVRDRELKIAVPFVVAFLLVGLINPHQLVQPYYWQMTIPFCLSIFAGAPTVRGIGCLVRR